MTDKINKAAAYAVLDALEAAGHDADTLGRVRDLIDMLKPVRFTREDVEKAAEGLYKTQWARQGVPGADRDDWNEMPKQARASWIEAATAALSAIGEVEHG